MLKSLDFFHSRALHSVDFHGTGFCCHFCDHFFLTVLPVWLTLICLSFKYRNQLWLNPKSTLTVTFSCCLIQGTVSYMSTLIVFNFFLFCFILFLYIISRLQFPLHLVSPTPPPPPPDLFPLASPQKKPEDLPGTST